VPLPSENLSNQEKQFETGHVGIFSTSEFGMAGAGHAGIFNTSESADATAMSAPPADLEGAMRYSLKVSSKLCIFEFGVSKKCSR
jgi:hypothetical protein